MEDALIKVRNVSKSYKDVTVIHNLFIDFNRGKSYGIMGYNGSGKSVILKLLSGYAFADSGEIRIDGKILKKDIDFIQDAGVVINAPEFIGSLSGIKNLMYLAEIRHSVTLPDIENIMKRLGLYDARKKKVAAYSQGMKQRLRFAQAIMEKPDILLLDEPFNALDKDGVFLVKEILREHVREGKTLIFTSHQKEDLQELADEVYEVENGSLVPAVL